MHMIFFLAHCFAQYQAITVNSNAVTSDNYVVVKWPADKDSTRDRVQSPKYVLCAPQKINEDEPPKDLA